jgi:hypothetical protein
VNDQIGIACKTCERGVLVPKNIHRLSGPAVVIGYIFLIPSTFAMTLFFVLVLLKLVGPILGIIVHLGDMVAIAFMVAVPAFIGGLLGWLLVMKKRVLQCSVCGATVNAS